MLLATLRLAGDIDIFKDCVLLVKLFFIASIVGAASVCKAVAAF